MKKIALCFNIHQPFRLKRYRFFDLGSDHYYYDDYSNEYNMRRLADQTILPGNKILSDLIAAHKDRFRVSFSISGTALDQFELYAPDVLESFQQLAATGCVEFLCDTDSCSLVSLADRNEFADQVKRQKARLKSYFNHESGVFCNTQMIYSDQIGDWLYDLGFQAVLTEGARHLLGWKSPNFVYCSSTNPRMKILLRNYLLSDDIGLNFSEPQWSEYPLTADKFASWLRASDPKEEDIILAMDYNVFGEKNAASSGIFEFLRYLPSAVFSVGGMEFSSLENISGQLPVGPLSVNDPISWVDEERDLTAWLGNELQQEAFQKLYSLIPYMKKIKDPVIRLDWRYLQTSNHFRFMSTKYFSTEKLFSIPSPYESPYDAFINYMNILSDFTIRVKAAANASVQKKTKKTREKTVHS